MRKFIAITEDFDGEDIWMLIDAENKDMAIEIASSEDYIKKVVVCKELEANSESGISHKFTVIE